MLDRKLAHTQDVVDFTDWLIAVDNDDFTDDLCFIEHPDYTKQPGDTYFSEPEVILEIETSFSDFQDRFQIPELYGCDSILNPALYPRQIDSIKSMVGDDETITCNSLHFAILCILIGSILPRIKISWSDVGCNKDMYNYAEGWVYLPPSADSSFESVNRYSRGSGVPFVLDPIKFRNMSAVRKQSEMERDLPSKFTNLAKTAAWTHPSWFTWDLHQYGLILGIECFDFMRSKLFPYLFETEGGCGGVPPWGNCHTAAAAIMRYRRGTAKTGILGVMKEAVDLFTGRLNPQNSYFLKNLYLAISGDKQWAAARSELIRMALSAEELGMEPFTDIHRLAEAQIPPELDRLATTISPEDVLTGAAVSFLRQKGYIYTELDVIMRVQNEFRLESIWGRTKMADIESQVEVRKEEYRHAYIHVISEIADRSTDPVVKAIMTEIPHPMSPEGLSIIDSYYRMKSTQSSDFNSFMYNDRIRVFKAKDVELFFEKRFGGLKNDFAHSTPSFWQPEKRRSLEFSDERDLADDIERWLDSGDLRTLLKQPLPPGVGPDDARIARTLQIKLREIITEESCDGFLIVLISNDKKMVTSVMHVIKHDLEVPIRILSLGIQDYLSYCLKTVATPVWDPREVRARKNQPYLAKGRIYNAVNKEWSIIRDPLLKLLEGEAKFLYSSRKPRLVVEYDVPNINRICAHFRYSRFDSSITELTGGYLSASFLRARSRFPGRPLEEIKRHPEFTTGRRRMVYPASKLRTRVTEMYNPQSVSWQST